MVKGMRPGVHDIRSGRDRENHPQDCRRAQAATTLKGIGRSRLMGGFSVEVSILLAASRSPAACGVCVGRAKCKIISKPRPRL